MTDHVAAAADLVRDLEGKLERALAENVQLHAYVDRVDALFAGGPDTPCRTTWREQHFDLGNNQWRGIECVEVPLDDLRAALNGGE